MVFGFAPAGFTAQDGLQAWGAQKGAGCALGLGWFGYLDPARPTSNTSGCSCTTASQRTGIHSIWPYGCSKTGRPTQALPRLYLEGPHGTRTRHGQATPVLWGSGRFGRRGPCFQPPAEEGTERKRKARGSAGRRTAPAQAVQ